jgi:hypothetical protein
MGEGPERKNPGSSWPFSRQPWWLGSKPSTLIQVADEKAVFDVQVIADPRVAKKRWPPARITSSSSTSPMTWPGTSPTAKPPRGWAIAGAAAIIITATAAPTAKTNLMRFTTQPPFSSQPSMGCSYRNLLLTTKPLYPWCAHYSSCCLAFMLVRPYDGRRPVVMGVGSRSGREVLSRFVPASAPGLSALLQGHQISRNFACGLRARFWFSLRASRPSAHTAMPSVDGRRRGTMRGV